MRYLRTPLPPNSPCHSTPPQSILKEGKLCPHAANRAFSLRRAQAMALLLLRPLRSRTLCSRTLCSLITCPRSQGPCAARSCPILSAKCRGPPGTSLFSTLSTKATVTYLVSTLTQRAFSKPFLFHTCMLQEKNSRLQRPSTAPRQPSPATIRTAGTVRPARAPERESASAPLSLSDVPGPG